MVLTLLYFILALLLLIVVHEYGHFAVARLCNVKVLRFSFGFGKVLASWYDKKGTEYSISLVPLGGYVKMLDEGEAEVAPEERHQAFNNKSLTARCAIVLAGPLFNFLFAFVALWLMWVIGINSLAPMIDKVTPGSIADKAGIQSKEEIISLEKEKISSWRDFQYVLMPLIGSDQTVLLGLKSMVNGQERSVQLPLSEWKIDSVHPDLLASFGMTPFIPTVPPIVGEVVNDSPAQKAGLLDNDVIKSVNGNPIQDWLEFVKIVRENPHQQLHIKISRQGKHLTFSVYPESMTNQGKEEGYLGVRSQKVDWPKTWLRVQRLGPLDAAAAAFKQTVSLTGSTFVLMTRLVTGKLGLKSISGPVGIAQGAGESGRSGFPYYLSFLAMVSISLGVLNLLPIPMLDGGHLLYYLIESIIGRPLSDTTKAIGMYFGMVLLIALMILAFSNDLSRFF